MRSSELQPGTRLQHADGKIVTLDRRKTRDELRSRCDIPYHPGWRLRDESGGLADFVIDADDSAWTVLA